MQDPDRSKADALPGNNGQFGQSVATEDYKPLRATQRVPVKPVVPRSHISAPPKADAPSSERAEGESKTHPS